MQTRFGIIGLGVQGALYAALLQGTPIQGNAALPRPALCRLTAVSTRNEATLAPYRAAGLACYTDWRSLIDAHACDAVLITVPHRLHAEIALYAMEHGLDVLCDKPAALRASDAARMADTAHRTGRALGYLFNQRANPLHRQVAELLQGGALGRVRRSVWVADAWWRPDSYYRSAAWRGSWRGKAAVFLSTRRRISWTFGSGFAGCRSGFMPATVKARTVRLRWKTMLPLWLNTRAGRSACSLQAPTTRPA